MRIAILAGTILVLAGCQHPGPPAFAVQTDQSPAFVLCSKSFASMEAARSSIGSDPGLERLPGNEHYVAYAERTNGTTWTLTRPGHPAHPALICRQLIMEGEQWAVVSQIRCGASRPSCDRLAEEFVQLDHQMRDAITRSRPGA